MAKKEVKKVFNEDEFLKELSEVVNKHGLKNCVFAGENEDEKMIGLFSLEKYGQRADADGMIRSALNASRLYQASREKIFYMLDKFSK